MSEAAVKQPPKEQVPPPNSSAPLRLLGMDHFVILCPDLVEAERWYVEVMGAEIVSRYNWGGDTQHDVPPHVDLRIGDVVISIFLGDPGPKPHRMIHHAYKCRDLDQWDQWARHVRACGVETVGPTGHDGFSLISLHFDDPWGHHSEIMAWLDSPEAAKRAVVERGGAITGRMRA